MTTEGRLYIGKREVLAFTLLRGEEIQLSARGRTFTVMDRTGQREGVGARVITDRVPRNVDALWNHGVRRNKLSVRELGVKEQGELDIQYGLGLSDLRMSLTHTK